MGFMSSGQLKSVLLSAARKLLMELDALLRLQKENDSWMTKESVQHCNALFMTLQLHKIFNIFEDIKDL